MISLDIVSTRLKSQRLCTGHSAPGIASQFAAQNPVLLCICVCVATVAKHACAIADVLCRHSGGL